MNKLKTKQRLFEINEYKDKVQNSLKNLESTQQPGAQSGKGNKTMVLQATKLEIQSLIKKGYTIKQIADALSNDVFGVIPKTITQLIGTKKTSKKPRARHTTTSPVDTPKAPLNQTVVKRKGPVTDIADVE